MLTGSSNSVRIFYPRFSRDEVIRKFNVKIILIISLIFLSAMDSFGAWPDDPETGVPICTADGVQEHPRITTDGATGAIIVWQDMSSNSSDIYAQRIDARGQIRWAKDGVAICLEQGDQWFPNLVSDGNGGAIIAWWDKRAGFTEMDIYAQRVDGDGQILWKPGGIPVCNVPGAQQELDIIPDGKGGAIIAWHDYRAKTDAPDIYIQRVNAKGETLWTKGGVAVVKTKGEQVYPNIVGDGLGGAYVTWHDTRDDSGDVYVQRVDANGRILWQENGIPISKAQRNQLYPAITSDGSGGVIITWMDDRDGQDWDIYAQRINPEGKTLWQENGIPICTAKGDQYDYCILNHDKDNTFIVWRDQRSGEWDIYAQKIDSEGNVKWAKDGIPICNANKDQYNPNIVTDGVNGVIVVWWDERDIVADIYAQRIDTNGKSLWIENGTAICTAQGGQQDAYPVNSGIGSAIITWWDKRRVDADIYAQRVFSE